ncbi:MAG: DUF4080 domain-containing protein [Thiohalomonadaceae bacterium]
MTDIVLAALNAKYLHASLGLRYLLANMGELRSRTQLLEFIWDQKPTDIAERILAEQPRIIALGIYIWNANEMLQLIQILKTVAPNIHIILGGPEISHEQQEQTLTKLADYVISGQGDLAFAELCRLILDGKAPTEKLIQATPPPLDQIKMPYDEYTDIDVAQRLIYVEASRGCPFKCEFCLSSLDKTAWPFALEDFLQAMDKLHRRGVRHFKFVDRTFNLNVKASQRILQFFLDRTSDDLFLHFEVIPDHLPADLKELLVKFPAGTLQLEVGVQTFNEEVQARISRKQDNATTVANLHWLREHTEAHLHVDLIVGLPGEDLDSFAASFNRLWELRPHEIQVGLLKRLRGTPIVRHTEEFAMAYAPQPPYSLLANRDLDFVTMQRLTRFARYWDMLANSGRFAHALPLLLANDAFGRFLQFSDWLHATSGQTHKIALPRLFQFIHQALTEIFAVPEQESLFALARDCSAYGAKGCPCFLHRHLQQIQQIERSNIPTRQARHLQTTSTK